MVTTGVENFYLIDKMYLLKYGKRWSDQPGLQVYTGHGMPRQVGAHEGQGFAPWNGLALEPQGYPDAVNQPGFPSVIVTPERPYRQVMSVEIAEGGS